MNNEDEDEDEDEDLGLHSVFPEEERPPSPPLSTATYRRSNGHNLSIQLVNRHPLWGHILYPTSISMADFLAQNSQFLINGKRVLELGAGAGLPSLISVLEGAAKTVVTDFPDASLLNNLQHNVDANIPEELRHLVSVQGFTWGSNPNVLLEPITTTQREKRGAFDTVLAADLVFNHSQHLALLNTCEQCLAGSSSPVLLCFYAHHRPTKELIAKDEGFINLAVSRGWTSERVLKDAQAGPAFPEDDQYDLAIRSTVHGFKLVPPA